MGSIIGMVAAFIAIYSRRRRQRVDMLAVVNSAKCMKEDEDDSGDSTQGRGQFNLNAVEVGELDNNEVHELAAVEPVGSELNTTRDANMEPIEWPLPLSPVPLLFAMTELRDERAGNDDLPKHKTYYNF